MKHFFQFFILIGVSFMCFLLGRCTDKETHCVKTITIRDTIPGKISPPDVRFVPIPQFVDTAAILKEHFAERVYRDTVVRYPELKVQVNDLVSRNQLLDRQVIIDYKRPAPCVNNALMLDFNVTDGSFPVMLGYRNKKITYKAGYDVLNKAVVLGLSIDLWRW